MRSLAMLPRRLVVVLAIAFAASAVGLSSAQTASAASANSGVYAVAPQWWGWCIGSGNYVTYVHYINYTTGQQYGDWGDDVVWMPVANGQWNTVQIAVQCRWSMPQGWTYSILPTRYGQTWWFGYPGGTYHN